MSYPRVSPQVMASFNQYWPGFSKSKQYRESEWPHEFDDAAPVIIRQYFESMNDVVGLNPTKWTVEAMRENAKALINSVPRDDLGVALASASLLTIQQFLKWLAKTGAFRVPQSTINVLLLPMMLKVITVRNLHHRNH